MGEHGGGAALAAGASTAQVAEVIFASAEAHLHLVRNIYARYLERDLDPSGQKSWTDLKNSGGSDELVLAAILGEMRLHEFYDKTLS